MKDILSQTLIGEVSGAFATSMSVSDSLSDVLGALLNQLDFL